jgi:hypothetical protein
MLGYESCCFVPQELNILLVLCDRFRRTLQLEAIVLFIRLLHFEAQWNGSRNFLLLEYGLRCMLLNLPRLPSLCALNGVSSCHHLKQLTRIIPVTRQILPSLIRFES